MISKIEIRNFTTQKKCDVEFGPHVTTLTGSSFTGKSTILRAIRFVCMNKPSGDKMISWGKDKTSVRLTVDTKKIIRRKGKGVNSYRLEKEHFAAFGNNVPQPIADLVNMGDLNFQGQHDKPFWFCKTAGEVSRELNAIVNLEVIDKTLAYLDSQIRETKLSVKITQKRLDDALVEKKNLAYITKLNEDLSNIEGLEIRHEQIAVELTTLCDIIEKGTEYREEQTNNRALASGGDSALEKGRIWRKILESTVTLENHVETGLSTSKLAQSPPDIKPLNKTKERWKSLWDEIGYLESMMEDIQSKEKELWERRKEVETTSSDLIKATKGVCPLCLRPMKKS